MRLRKFALLGALTFFTYVGVSDARTAPNAVHSLVNMPPDRSYMRLVVCTSDQANVCLHWSEDCMENIPCPGGAPRSALGVCIKGDSGGVDGWMASCDKSYKDCLQVCGDILAQGPPAPRLPRLHTKQRSTSSIENGRLRFANPPCELCRDWHPPFPQVKQRQSTARKFVRQARTASGCRLGEMGEPWRTRPRKTDVTPGPHGRSAKIEFVPCFAYSHRVQHTVIVSENPMPIIVSLPVIEGR